MALIVVAVIIAMSLILGAEQGPKADPTSTTYVPRPEWYFFFLFELLRVIKPPELVPIATIGIPTICMVLLLLLPFYDRGPERRPERRPIATTAGCLTIVAMAYLTYLGATGGSPTEIEMEVAPQLRGRQGGRRRRRLPRLPQDRRERQQRPRPGTDPHRRADAAGGDHPLGRNRARHHALLPRPAAEEAQRAGRLPLLARLADGPVRRWLDTAPAAPRDSAQFAGQVNRMFDRVAARYDVLNSVMTAGLHHRWRERAADRAELAPGDSALDVCCGTGDLALELAARVAPGRPRGRLRLLRADARPRPREGRAPAAPPASASSGPTRSAALRRRPLRRRHGRLRRPQPRRPRPRPARDGAGAEPGRPAGDPRDHPADPAAALDLLLALVRPHRAAARHALGRPRGLLLPARVGAQLPQPARPGGEDGRRRPRARSATRSSPAGSSRSTAASPGDPPLGRPAAGDGGPRRVEPLAAARLGEVEERLRERSPGHGELLARGRAATLAAGGKRLRPLLVLLCAGPDGGRGRGPGRDRDRARPHGDPGPRRRPRRRAAAPRPADRRRHLGPRARRRRPATCSSRAPSPCSPPPATRARSSCSPRPRSPSPAASWPSATTPSTPAISEQRYLERCRLKTATLFECACLLGRDERGDCARSAPRSASPSSCSTTSSTSPARRSGPARRAAPTCSTAPSPCR